MSEVKKGKKHANYGKHHSLETRRKISEALKGRPRTPEHRRRLSEAMKGEGNPNYGKHFSVEHRRKISESMKGIKRSSETRRKMVLAWQRRKQRDAAK